MLGSFRHRDGFMADFPCLVGSFWKWRLFCSSQEFPGQGSFTCNILLLHSTPLKSSLAGVPGSHWAIDSLLVRLKEWSLIKCGPWKTGTCWRASVNVRGEAMQSLVCNDFPALHSQLLSVLFLGQYIGTRTQPYLRSLFVCKCAILSGGRALTSVFGNPVHP